MIFETLVGTLIILFNEAFTQRRVKIRNDGCANFQREVHLYKKNKAHTYVCPLSPSPSVLYIEMR